MTVKDSFVYKNGIFKKPKKKPQLLHYIKTHAVVIIIRSSVKVNRTERERESQEESGRKREREREKNK